MCVEVFPNVMLSFVLFLPNLKKSKGKAFGDSGEPRLAAFSSISRRLQDFTKRKADLIIYLDNCLLSNCD